jgi:hypothetical protein
MFYRKIVLSGVVTAVIAVSVLSISGLAKLPAKASRHEQALGQFPEYEACAERGFSPDGASFFDLHSVFQTQEELERCYYWLFSKPGTVPEDVIAYFRGVDGVSVSDLSLQFAGRRNGQPVPGRSVQASWNPSHSGIPFGGFFERKWIEFIAYGAILSVIFDDNDQLMRISLGLTIE